MSLAACLREHGKLGESIKIGKEALKLVSDKYGEENLLTGVVNRLNH